MLASIPTASAVMRSPFARILTCLFAAAISLGNETASAQHVSSSPRPSLVRESFTKGDFVGDFYYTPASSKKRSVLVLGGSEGGIPRYSAEFLSSKGNPVLALAYFGAPGTPDGTAPIPLEYFEKAVAWLKTRPEVRQDRVVISGGSRGAELALLLASRMPAICGVIATAPSAVV